MFLTDAIKQGYEYSLIKCVYHVQHTLGKKWKQEIFVNGKQGLEYLLRHWNERNDYFYSQVQIEDKKVYSLKEILEYLQSNDIFVNVLIEKQDVVYIHGVYTEL